MNPDYCIDIPPGFDDSDEDSQVHPIACRQFSASTAAEVFGKAQHWISQHNVFLIDVSWTCAYGESEPFVLAVYFSFEDTAEEPAAGSTA
ncbi:hypothetical protein [Nocardia terpenica]|uniref:Uncharacterized protein n=1 Tax=Nocardia terpenica TaxID=455432 RepID=A0A291RQ67_9NOCA|nr:hypothetical protein [Nocardia terpenica]ATL69364.1 hypothetical protein CRH09_27465 [Nocardia terpenica]